uniref:Uncharacterized protein n=1 Tax=Terrapene triunguis TaxID=2587831 RepID=A0A674IV39_9SAUR
RDMWETSSAHTVETPFVPIFCFLVFGGNSADSPSVADGASVFGGKVYYPPPKYRQRPSATEGLSAKLLPNSQTGECKKKKNSSPYGSPDIFPLTSGHPSPDRIFSLYAAPLCTPDNHTPLAHLSSTRSIVLQRRRRVHGEGESNAPPQPFCTRQQSWLPQWGPHGCSRAGREMG